MTKAIFNIFCSLCGRCFLRFSRQGFDRLFDITSLSQSLVNENPKNTVDKDKYKDSPRDTFNVLQQNYDFFSLVALAMSDFRDIVSLLR